MINDLTREQQEVLREVFTYHPPTEEDISHYYSIREAARYLAEVIIVCCPPCADRTAAIRSIREGVHMANASIALKGKNI